MFAVKDLHFTYPKNKEETIKGISFEIGKGEIFGFLGKFLRSFLIQK